ncbi:TIGR03013 family PEP-CTERM/XrtA system glycosyltransferase [Marinobacteraceae bacterium S3BR75-40.1]
MAHVRVFRHYIHLPFAILGLLDFLSLVSTFYVATFFRFFGDVDLLLDSWTYVLPSAIVFGLTNLIVMLALGVHQAHVEEGLSGLMLRTIMALILSLPLSTMAYLAFPDWLWYMSGDGVLASASVFGFFLLGILRSIFFALVGDDAFKRRVLVLGAGFRANQLFDDLRSPLNRKGFTLLGFVPNQESKVEVPAKSVLNITGSLHDYAVKHAVDEIVVAVDDRRAGLPLEDLVECKMEGVYVLDGANFYERESRKVALEMITPSWLVFSDGFNLSSVSGFGKRAMDLVASLALLAVASPFMLLTTLAIKLEDGWRAPILYSQERVGLNGKSFYVHKFRSMRPDAEKGGAVWAKKHDDRVTKVGAFIRKVRIDELPQIFNVIKGEMAFVGPRPERPVFVEQLAEKIPYYNERHRVKPGITGWAQLCFAYAESEEDSREKLRYDLYYIKNQSLLLDLLIILQTVEVVLFKKGAH